MVIYLKKIILFLLLLFLIPLNVFSKDSVIVMDINSKRVLYEENINEKRLIASTTKIMTCILAIENKELTDIVKVGDEILTMYGSNIYLEVGEEITLLDLLYGMMLRSGNDSATTIAKYVSGSEEKFVKLMNKKAIEIGMLNTSFSNPTGLDDDTKNYSTAYDMALLYSYAYKNKNFRDIVGTKYYKTESSSKNYYWNNRNEILKKYDFATGGKTGYTPDAGRVLVTSASKDNLDLVAVSFKSIYDYNNQIALYNELFDKYNYVKLISKNTKINNRYPKEDYYYTLTDDEKNNILIDNDDSIKIYLNDKLLKEIEYKKEKVNKKSIFSYIKKLLNI